MRAPPKMYRVEYDNWKSEYLGLQRYMITEVLINPYSEQRR